MSPLRLRVQYFRERKGWTQSDLARKSGVAQSVVWRVEAGKTRTLSLANLEKLAAALGVAPGSLFERTRPKPARSRG